MLFDKKIEKINYIKELEDFSLEELKNELHDISFLRDSEEMNYNIFKGSIYHEVIREALNFLSCPEKVQDDKIANEKFRDILEKGFMYSIWSVTDPYNYQESELLRKCSFTKNEILEIIGNIYDEIKTNDYKTLTAKTALGIRNICKYCLWYYFDLKAYKDDELIKNFKDAPDIMFPNKHFDMESKMKTIIGNIIGIFQSNEISVEK